MPGSLTDLQQRLGNDNPTRSGHVIEAKLDQHQPRDLSIPEIDCRPVVEGLIHEASVTAPLTVSAISVTASTKASTLPSNAPNRGPRVFVLVGSETSSGR